MQRCHSRIVPDLSFSLWITRCILSSKKFAQTFRKWREASPLAGKIVLSCEKYLARRYFTAPLMRSVFFLRRKGKGGGGVEPLNRDSVMWTWYLQACCQSPLPSEVWNQRRSSFTSNFFREIKYLFKILSFLKSTGYIQKFFLLFFVLLRSGNSTWASLTRKRYFQHSKIKFVSPRGHVISSIYALILVKKLTNNCESSCLSTHVCDPPRDFRE